jgi:ABC-type branched-subunit amino acid transport system permease subunit
MGYYWISIAVLFLVAIFSDTTSWSPFASEQVKAVCAHMTPAERYTAMKRGALAGLVIGLVPGMIGLLLGVVIFRSALAVVAICLLLLPVIALVFHRKWWPKVVKWQQDFLASTEWAQSQGIKAENIRLYHWHGVSGGER